MALILAVPEQQNDDAGAAGMNPGHTREWIAQLPLLDANSSIDQVHTALHKSNRTSFRAITRLRQLELYRKPVHFIGKQLEKLVNGSFLPLSHKDQEFAETCLDVTIEMAYGYKVALLDLAKQKNAPKQSQELCIAIHRAITYLTLTLYQSAICYNSAPPGTWNELHSLYIYALRLHVESMDAKDSLKSKKTNVTVAQAYKHAMLFGLTNIYNNSVPVITKSYRYLERWAHSLEVKRFSRPESTRHKFIIDPEEDFPPRAYIKEMRLKRPRRMLLLDTREITELAHEQWKNLRTGTSRNHVGLGRYYHEDGSFDMLERVITSLGIAPKRKYTRTPATKSYQLGVGVDAVNFFLNGGKPFECSLEDAKYGRKFVSSGTFGMYQTTKREQQHHAQPWTSVDESAHGLSLYVDLAQPQAVQVRVGELVAIHAPKDEISWSSGIIRWVRAKDTELCIGIQKLGVDTLPIAIRPVKPRDPGEEILKFGILLPESGEIERRRGLITPTGVFQKQRNFFLDDGSALVMVRAQRLVERNSHFEWFEYEILDL